MNARCTGQIGRSQTSVVAQHARLARSKSCFSTGYLQRSAVNTSAVSAIPQSVYQTLQSAGQPLDAATRSFMEPRFGQDFSQVRVHADSQAAESARAVNAHAYTVGNDVAFGRAQYAPGTQAGNELLAHELVHTVQQKDQSTAASTTRLEIPHASDSPEREAEQVSRRMIASPADFSRIERIGSKGLGLQRKLGVNPSDVIPLSAGQQGPPEALTNAVQNLIDDTCPDGDFKVDPGTGTVSSRQAFCEWHPPLVTAVTEANASKTPVGCACLCDVVKDSQTTTVGFSPGGPGTSPASVPGAGPGQAGSKANPTVSIDPRFQGQYKINGKWVDVPFHLLFSHELCGHARPKMHGTHVARGAVPAGGTPPQEQAAVDVERGIAAEHNPPLPRRPDDYSGAARQKP